MSGFASVNAFRSGSNSNLQVLPRANGNENRLFLAMFLAWAAAASPRNCYRGYLGGATVVLVDPSGAGCIPGALCPWGLSGGAPPEPVLVGPVQPCGCN